MQKSASDFPADAIRREFRVRAVHIKVDTRQAGEVGVCALIVAQLRARRYNNSNRTATTGPRPHNRRRSTTRAAAVACAPIASREALARRALHPPRSHNTAGVRAWLVRADDIRLARNNRASPSSLSTRLGLVEPGFVPGFDLEKGPTKTTATTKSGGVARGPIPVQHFNFANR